MEVSKERKKGKEKEQRHQNNSDEEEGVVLVFAGLDIVTKYLEGCVDLVTRVDTFEEPAFLGDGWDFFNTCELDPLGDGKEHAPWVRGDEPEDPTREPEDVLDVVVFDD